MYMNDDGAAMNFIFGMLFGYIIHDAVQQTPFGEVLDKVALSEDLFSAKGGASNEPSV